MVTSAWDSGELFEAWCSGADGKAALTSLPPGVFQYAAAVKGEGMPEPYTPLRASPAPPDVEGA